MPGVYLRVKSNEYNINIPMERRITYLRGDSGVGKSSLVEFIRSSEEDNDELITVEKPAGYTIDILNSLSSTLDIESKYNSILIIDDNINSEGNNFSNAVNNYLLRNDLYLLIINRVDLADIQPRGQEGDYSAKSILKVVKDGVNHIVYPYLCELPEDYGENKGYVLGEDKKGITLFFNNYNINKDLVIDSTTPKCRDDIIPLLKNRMLRNNKKIFLFVDLASFGRYLSDLLSLAKNSECNIVLDFNYECFEYMMLRSNLFRTGFDITNEANDYISWEKYFEEKLKELSSNNVLRKYTHSKGYSECFLVGCESCDISKNIQGGCPKAVPDNGDKLSYLLKGTEFEYIIGLLRG